MKRLKANKTTLYNLVRDMAQDLDWIHIPSLRKVSFVKVYCRPDFVLRWRNVDGTHFQAFLCVCDGNAILTISLNDVDKYLLYCIVYHQPIDNLMKRGMVEDIS